MVAVFTNTSCQIWWTQLPRFPVGVYQKGSWQLTWEISEYKTHVHCKSWLCSTDWCVKKMNIVTLMYFNLYSWKWSYVTRLLCDWSTGLNFSTDYYWAFNRQSSTFKGKHALNSESHSNSITVGKIKLFAIKESKSQIRRWQTDVRILEEKSECSYVAQTVLLLAHKTGKPFDGQFC